MTFSIIARCPRTGELGVGVTTAWFAVGSVAPMVRRGVGAVSSQGVPNPGLRVACLDRLAAGQEPDQALRAALGEDPMRDHRQIGVIDARGSPSAFTGAACEASAAYVIDNGCVISGNSLTSRSVLDSMLSSWESVEVGKPLAERILAALEAGQRVGGDKRGRQSAALFVTDAHPILQIDLRVDDHRDPLVEMRRLLTLFREKYEPLYRSPQAPRPRV